MLYVSASLRERVRVPRRGYRNLEDPNDGLEARLHEDARRFDSLSLSAEAVACALAATRLLASAGWETVHERARTLAGRLAQLLAEAGIELAPRGPSTLVSFVSPDPETESARLAAGGVILRSIPGRPWLRASVGAWNDEDDLGRLLGMLTA
jgi:L-cysteine/cystine lyase